MRVSFSSLAFVHQLLNRYTFIGGGNFLDAQLMCPKFGGKVVKSKTSVFHDGGDWVPNGEERGT